MRRPLMDGLPLPSAPILLFRQSRTRELPQAYPQWIR